jgi:hypothetical protein
MPVIQNRIILCGSRFSNLGDKNAQVVALDSVVILVLDCSLNKNDMGDLLCQIAAIFLQV